MVDKLYTVLFLSQRNSARSVMAEAIVNRHGQGRFRGFSAGVRPGATLEAFALEVLATAGYPTDGLRPRHYLEFAAHGAADLDFVFTLSDTAAGEPMPEWPGRPVTAHWPCEDPILVAGEEWERRRAFGLVLAGLERRLRIFMSLPFPSLDRLSLKGRIEEIGRGQGAS
jgi:arsenate reductase (thioredoxin)